MFESQNRHEKWKVESGICKHCKKPATHGVYCEEHREKYNIFTREIREKRRAENSCISCGLPNDPHSITYCTAHMLENRKRLFIKDKKLSGGIKLLLGVDRMDKKLLMEERERLAKFTNLPDFLLPLEANEKAVLDLRILSGTMSLRTVGKRLNISYESVRTIEEALALKLKKYIDGKNKINPTKN